MIIADTNVVSELMRCEPSEYVRRWIVSLPSGSLFTTTITQAEIFVGIALLPLGRRRRDLQVTATKLFSEVFEKRCLAFDEHAAPKFADVIAKRRQAGRPVGLLDAQIAGIALATNASLATRNTADFEGVGLTLCNPWQDE